MNKINNLGIKMNMINKKIQKKRSTAWEKRLTRSHLKKKINKIKLKNKDEQDYQLKNKDEYEQDQQLRNERWTKSASSYFKMNKINNFWKKLNDDQQLKD